MTGEEKKAYARAWYAKNKEKVKEYQRKSALKKAVQDIESGKVCLVTRVEFQETKPASGAF